VPDSTLFAASNWSHGGRFSARHVSCAPFGSAATGA
jgi:hypothetical protein